MLIPAANFFVKVLQNNHTIIVSSIIQDEIDWHYHDLQLFLRPFRTKFVRENESLLRKSIMLSASRSIPAGDALHALLAQKHHALLITRDKHFQKLKDIIPVLKPEEAFDIF